VSVCWRWKSETSQKKIKIHKPPNTYSIYLNHFKIMVINVKVEHGKGGHIDNPEPIRFAFDKADGCICRFIDQA
jgi:hypothetical protein